MESPKHPRLPTPAELWELQGETPERVLRQRLRAFREEVGMTQAQVAEAMTRQGFSMRQSTIWKIETGHRPVTVNEAVALATIVGVQLPDLLADPVLDAEALAISDELRQALVRRQAAEAEIAELLSRRAQDAVKLSEARRRAGEADDMHRDAQRRWRLARYRATGRAVPEED